MKKIIFLVVLFSLMLTAGPVPTYAEDSEKSLAIILKLQNELNAVFSKLNSDVAEAAREIGETGISGEDTRRIIRNLAKSTGDYSVDCSTISAKGIMTVVEPIKYKKYEGSDISKQPQVLRLLRTGKPIMADLFMSVEGFYASTIDHPVFSAKGDLLGSVSLLFKPDKIFSLVIEPAIKDLPVHAWVMQKDSRILYDTEPKEIGKILLEDPLYRPFPGVAVFVKKVAAERSGYGSYDFYDIGTRNVVSKDAVWTTIYVNGTEWRLVVTRKKFDVNEKQDVEIKAATQTSVSMLQAIYDKSKRGEITNEQARKEGADILRILRYGKEGQGYFWADTVDGINVVLPVNREIEGTNRLNANLKGVYYIREIITHGRQPGGGYTDYWFPKPGSTEPSKKRGYSLLFEPFGWVVGTGYYPD